ncbi:FxLYD domain-containing protein [Halopelagius fulvigenes]|uniref:FxLYD domain-containing protein n=1 Tax=Halopelagius fulvigenes TaxID=1198324 RepID=A0ABD5U607_9EURY
MASLGGCAGSGGSSSTYVDGEIDPSEIDASNNSSRSPAEVSAAAAVAEVEATNSASSLDSLRLDSHEFAVEGGYKGPVVRGTVTNTSDQKIKLAEVRVRVFDDNGTYLGLFVDSVGELPPETTWQFEVLVLASLDKLATYDIGVFGIPE